MNLHAVRIEVGNYELRLECGDWVGWLRRMETDVWVAHAEVLGQVIEHSMPSMVEALGAANRKLRHLHQNCGQS